jgi:methylphosphotriester-DNA--protein-cysteine methyltransferase
MPPIHDLSLATMTTAPITDDDKWNAVLTRDAALKGAFYICVKTTSIYCNSGCPARTPLRKNVTFLATSAAAQAGGFRPCKRCKPPS